MPRNRHFPGGRTTPIDPKLRAKAMRIALRKGAEAASRATGVAEGTIRSWQARARAKVERQEEGAGVLERLKAEGRAMLARQAEERAARLASEPPPSQPAPKPKRQR
jgi:hypothetical protein